MPPMRLGSIYISVDAPLPLREFGYIDLSFTYGSVFGRNASYEASTDLPLNRHNALHVAGPIHLASLPFGEASLIGILCAKLRLKNLHLLPKTSFIETLHMTFGQVQQSIRRHPPTVHKDDGAHPLNKTFGGDHLFALYKKLVIPRELSDRIGAGGSKVGFILLKEAGHYTQLVPCQRIEGSSKVMPYWGQTDPLRRLPLFLRGQTYRCNSMSDVQIGGDGFERYVQISTLTGGIMAILCRALRLEIFRVILTTITEPLWKLKSFGHTHEVSVRASLK
ncbi:hypothetical protein M569_10431, partial [Genlisea aurea]